MRSDSTAQCPCSPGGGELGPCEGPPAPFPLGPGSARTLPIGGKPEVGEREMDAEIGDRLVLTGRLAGGHDRVCGLVEIRDISGEPPYLVRWYDTGDEELWSPDPNANLMNLGHALL